MRRNGHVKCVFATVFFGLGSVYFVDNPVPVRNLTFPTTSLLFRKTQYAIMVGQSEWRRRRDDPTGTLGLRNAKAASQADGTAGRDAPAPRDGSAAGLMCHYRRARAQRLQAEYSSADLRRGNRRGPICGDISIPCQGIVDLGSWFLPTGLLTSSHSPPPGCSRHGYH
jgi:hypothetical protein